MLPDDGAVPARDAAGRPGARADSTSSGVQPGDAPPRDMALAGQLDVPCRGNRPDWSRRARWRSRSLGSNFRREPNVQLDPLFQPSRAELRLGSGDGLKEGSPMRSRVIPPALTLLAILAAWMPVEAQRYPLAPRVSFGESMHPFFEGWYELEDGSKVFSFGYFNRNLGDNPTYIPGGEDNFIEPTQFDGLQPDWFPIRRERGVFVVTVAPDWPASEPVTWTFRSRGELFSVSGTWQTDAMQLTTGPAAMGSDRPYLRMDSDGEEGYGIIDPVWGEPRAARVGEPFEITIWARDHMVQDAAREELVPVRATMWIHQGPSTATIVAEQPEEEEPEPQRRGGGRDDRGSLPNSVLIPLESDGAARFSVVFDEPGEHLLRVMVDNHNAVDSSQGNQCCWTNGYVEVDVRP